jgi:hypothetical protein
LSAGAHASDASRRTFHAIEARTLQQAGLDFDRWSAEVGYAAPLGGVRVHLESNCVLTGSKVGKLIQC